MRVSSISILISILSTSVSGTKDPKCTQGIQGLLAPLTAYAPATSFCKSKFPQPTRTSLTTTTQTLALKTSTSTSTAPAAVVTVTNTIDTIVTTATVTAAAARKRNAAPAAAPVAAPEPANDDQRAAQWASIVKVAGAVLSSFCSCAVAPSTTTITQTTATQPFTTTTTIVTPTSFTTTNVVFTTTTTTTVPARPAASFCPNGNSGSPTTGPSVGCKDGCYCDNYIRGGGVCNNGFTCLQECTSDASCNADQVCVTNTGCNTNGNTCAPIYPCADAPAARLALAVRRHLMSMYADMEKRGLAKGENRRKGKSD